MAEENHVGQIVPFDDARDVLNVIAVRDVGMEAMAVLGETRQARRENIVPEATQTIDDAGPTLAAVKGAVHQNERAHEPLPYLASV